ncbi:MAG TPA: ABC transporter substrate-binding protein [Candidatus Binataceae bacterium]|nr:ABC transporter substrate-binding protein [Candidatus Binataceae bacterium]
MLAVIVVAATIPAASADDSPTEVVKSVVNPALQILNDKSTPLKDRQQKLRDLVSPNVFDYSAMTRSAMGMHWKDINQQQQQDVTQVFTAFLRDSYISRIQDFSVDQVNFLGQSDLGNGNIEVRTSIQQPNAQSPVQLNYSLHQQNGKWLIYDVAVDNISIAANYRNQFNRVINNQGFDTLLADLRRKQQGLEDQLGTHHDNS